MTPDHQLAGARLVRRADQDQAPITMGFEVDEFRAATVMTVYAQDHPGLFARLSGTIAVCGAGVVDAKIFTTKDGMALDSFWIQNANGRAVKDKARLKRLEQMVKDTLKGEVLPARLLSVKPAIRQRTEVFTVEPVVFIDNRASNTNTVIEVNGRDRPGLLFDLAWAFYDLNLSIASAHVATYGERAVDVFYVRDLFGHKVIHAGRLKAVETRLLKALSGESGSRREKRKASPEAAVAGLS